MSETKKEERFIEVKKILASSDKMNNGSEPCFINVSEIKNFRPWHKGANDVNIKGNMTLVVLNHSRLLSVVNDNVLETNEKFRTILIDEDYGDFSQRMRSKAQMIFVDVN